MPEISWFYCTHLLSPLGAESAGSEGQHADWLCPLYGSLALTTSQENFPVVWLIHGCDDLLQSLIHCNITAGVKVCDQYTC